MLSHMMLFVEWICSIPVTMSLAACTAKSTAKDVIDSLGPGFNLIGVNIIVTGASSGIGAEAVRAH